MARLAQGTIDTYFAQNNLADFWVSVPSADRDTLERIRSISGVSDVCARATAELESTLPGEPTLNVTAYDGPMRINQPLVVEGEALSQTDSRGCLIQAGFAEVHGLSVGDRVSVKLSGQEYGFVVRGLQPGVYLCDRWRIPQPRSVWLHPHQYLRHAGSAHDAGAGKAR